MRQVPDNYDQFVGYELKLSRAEIEHSGIHCIECNREIEFTEEYIQLEGEAICLDKPCLINCLRHIGTLKECLPF